jgi:hypothetical protein
MAVVRQRKRGMVDRQIAAHLQNYKSSGAELILGEGRFVAPKTLEVRLNDGGTRVLTGEKVFLNVGTLAFLECAAYVGATAHAEKFVVDAFRSTGVTPFWLLALEKKVVSIRSVPAARG